MIYSEYLDYSYADPAESSITLDLASKSSTRAKRASDSQLKENAYSVPLMALVNLKCDKSCEYDGVCLSQTSLSAIFALRIGFWGEENTPAPTSSQRKQSILDILHDAYSVNEKKLTFVVPDSCANGSSRAVCQLAFLHLIGLTVKPKLSDAPKQWLLCRNSVLSGCVQDVSKYKLIDKPKFCHALSYIRYITDKMADTTPYGLPNGQKVKIVPYEDVRQFFAEYKAHCMSLNVDRTERAEEQTFRKAMLSLPNVRLIGCKGSFHTCELCNNAHELLRDPMKRYTREQREVIHQYKLKHLQQQQRERETLEENKHLCTEMDADGNVRSALFAIGTDIEYDMHIVCIYRI